MLLITSIEWTPDAVRHIWERHRVTVLEVEEVCYADPWIRRARDDRYTVWGQTDAGRYLIVVVVYLGSGRVGVVTARDMNRAERRLFARRGK